MSITNHHQQLQPSASVQYAPQTAPLNVLGIIALTLLVLKTIFNVLAPIMVSPMSFGEGAMTFIVLTSVINMIFILAATGFALGGVMIRKATRMRWTAVGSLVAAVLALIAALGSLMLNVFAYVSPL